MIGAWMEFVGGLLFLLGLFTRPVAFLLCGEMAVAYFMFHAKGGPFPILNHGEPTVVYCFVFLFFVFAGAGRVEYRCDVERGRRAGIAVLTVLDPLGDHRTE